jgi:hypothetical protein
MSATAVSFEAQLAALESLGIRLRDGITADDVLESWNRSDYEKEPYRLLLVAMGSDLEREPYPRISDDVWHFDTECIEDDGAYVEIARRVDGLSGGRLAITRAEDGVDIEGESAWLTVESGGSTHRWDLAVNDDWVDPEVFLHLEELLDETHPRQRLIVLELGGQDCVLLVGDEHRLAELRRVTGLPFAWLNS